MLHIIMIIHSTINNLLFSEIEVNSGRIFTDMRSMEVNILKATIHRD